LARRTTRQDIWFTAIRLVVFMHRGMIHHWAHNCKTSELSNSNSWLLWDRFRGNLGVHLRREIAAFERTLLDPLGI
jgi:G:T-mismatch repair DNA endonuclease (very short patch repair protein)